MDGRPAHPAALKLFLEENSPRTSHPARRALSLQTRAARIGSEPRPSRRSIFVPPGRFHKGKVRYLKVEVEGSGQQGERVHDFAPGFDPGPRFHFRELRFELLGATQQWTLFRGLVSSERRG